MLSACVCGGFDGVAYRKLLKDVHTMAQTTTECVSDSMNELIKQLKEPYD